MHFAPNTRKILRHAWSIRILAAAGLLSTIEAALPYVASSFHSPALNLALAIATPIVIGAAFVARLVAQKTLERE